MSGILLSVSHYLPTLVWIVLYFYFGMTLKRLPPSLMARYEKHFTAQGTLFLTKCFSIAAFVACLITAMSMILELCKFGVDSNRVGLLCGVGLIVFSLLLSVWVRLRGN